MNAKATRRDFLGTTTAVAAATWAGGKAYAADAPANVSPNSVINMALIGCGGQGRAVMRGFKALNDARIVAVCDLNETRLEQARQEAGGERILTYHDYRKLLDNRDINAVIIATNDHWHVLPTIDACRAGKDVYVEKPLGTSIGEGRVAVNAARKYDRVVQIGTQQHSWAHYREAVEIIQSGKLGEISEVKIWDMDYHFPGYGAPPDSDPPKELDWDFWVGPSPKVPYNRNRYYEFYRFFDYAGAWPVDWGVHHYDIVHWALGVKWPLVVTALGGKLAFQEPDNTQWPDTFSGVLQYGPGPVAKRGFLLQYTYRGACRREQRSHAKCFFGSEASMLLDRSGYSITAELKRTPGKFTEVVTKATEGARHAQVFLEHVRNRTRPAADVETGHYASNPGHLMNIAWRVGRQVRWDGEKEQIINDPEANALVTKTYRAPWKLEV